jgi:O-antigen/teichoic acid export membrane protein
MAPFELRQVRQSLRESGLAVLDQSAVSLASFAMTLVLGRVAGPAELALYALALTLLLMMTAVQDSLVSTPYAIYASRLHGADRAEYAGCSLVFCAGLSLGTTALLVSGGTLVLAGLGPTGLGRILLVAAAIAPGLVLREFGRRASAADLRVGAALALDLAVGVVQAAGLVWLASRGSLTAANALAAVGAANAAGALVWLTAWHAGGRIRIRRERLAQAWRQHWALGRWIGASRIVGHLGSDVLLLWLLTFMLGASSAGAFAACLMIAFLTNPFVLGVALFLTPKIAATVAAGGVRAAVRYAAGATVALGLPMAVFVATVAIAGERLIDAFYGPAYTGLGPPATAVALAVALGALAIGATNALLALERPVLNLVASLLGLVTMLASAAVLIPGYGVLGAALSFCAGNAVQLLARFAMLARIVAANSDRRPAPMEFLRGGETI